jgi:hypothetical protein
MVVIGYKGFNRYLCSNPEIINSTTIIPPFQYEVGKIYTMNSSEIEVMGKGFHFCLYPLDVLKYNNAPTDKYAIIEADDRIINSYYLSVTNNIKICKLITRDDLFKLMPNEIYRISDYEKLSEESRDYIPWIWQINCYKCREWYNDGLLHRDDGPAREFENGFKIWS